MKRVIPASLFLILFFIAPVAKAQTDALRTQLNTIFQNIDKSQIPTGFLEEYGAGLVPLDVFNGQLTDSNRMDIDLWRYAYGSVFTSHIYGTNSLPTLESINTIVNANTNLSTNILAIPLALINFSRMREDAVGQNLFTVSNNQINDVSGRTQSPYIPTSMFIASPAKNYTSESTVSILFKSSLFITNTGKTVSNLFVDFANGSGYQPAYFDTPLPVTYSDTGYKRLKIKLVCNDNSVYECYAEFNVLELTPQARYGTPDFVRTFNATANHSGGTATVRMSIRGTERLITKPLIVVEGYDVSDVAPSLITTPYDYNRFLRVINTEPGTYDFNGNLDDIAGYDLIFINYNNGTDDILRNAALFQEVLQWVNDQKATNSSVEQNVVLGISMGGLVARYGLADLTKNNLPTGTRLLITHDSPHRGANTPLGFQYVTRFLATLPPLAGFNINTIPVIVQANQLLNEQATQQMLILRATGRNTFVTNSFLDGVYRNRISFATTDPPPTYRIIATSNGSECGVNTLAPGSDMVDAAVRFIVHRPWIARKSRIYADINIKALPNGGAPITIAYFKVSGRIRIFFGLINFPLISIDLLDSQSPANTLPWDGAPGGTQPIRKNLPSNIPTNFEQFIAMEAFSGTLKVNAFLADNFCFVPTVSALDVTNITHASLNAVYVGGASPGNATRVANFIAQEPRTVSGQTLFNIAHPSFTARNAEWLWNEMEGVPNNNLNCSNNCSIPIYTISGPEFLCNTGDYFITGLSPNASVSWSASAPSMVQVSCTNCSQTTLTRVYSGVITLTANITSNCAPFNTTITKTVTVGPPDQNSLYAIFSTTGYSNYLQDYNCLKTYTFPGMYSGEVSLTDPVTTSFSWSFVSKYPSTAIVSIGGSTDGRNMTVTVKPSGAQVTYRLTRTNGCGTYTHDYTFIANGFCSGMDEGMVVQEENLRLAPNPSAGTFNVLLQSTGKDKAIKMIVIRNKFGAEMKRITFIGNANSQNINIQNLPMDVYSVEVFDGTKWRVEKIIKQ